MRATRKHTKMVTQRHDCRMKHLADSIALPRAPTQPHAKNNQNKCHWSNHCIDTCLSHSIRLLAKQRFANDNSYLVVGCPCRVEAMLKKWQASLGTGVKKRNENMYQKFSLNSKPAEIDELVQVGFPPVLVFSSVHPISKMFISTRRN